MDRRIWQLLWALVGPVVGGAVGAGFLVGGQQLGQNSLVPGSPGLLPVLSGSGALAMGLWSGGAALAAYLRSPPRPRPAAGGAAADAEAESPAPEGLRWVATVIGTLLYIALLPRVGFFLTTLVFVPAMGPLIGDRSRAGVAKGLAFGMVMVALVYLTFVWWLHVPLPLGLG